MKHCLLSIFSFTLLLLAFTVNAQDSTRVVGKTMPDSMAVTMDQQESTTLDKKLEKRKRVKVKKPDSLKIQVNSGLQVYIDYGKIATLVSDFEQKLEVGIGYQFSNRLQPNFQYGIGKVEPGNAIDNGEYLSEGTYWRAGINYMVPLDNINSLFLGVKYGQSQFDDSGSYEITSELWETFTQDFSRSGFTADWFSIILGSEKKLMNGQFIIGGQTGVRILNERDKADFIDIYTIPGYGLTSDKGSVFLNLYVKYHLSF